jgi:ABC-type phosphate/phosphonate transport system substrate-binding protein
MSMDRHMKALRAVQNISAGGSRRIIHVLLILMVFHLATNPQIALANQQFHLTVGFSAGTFVDIDKEQAKSICALWAELVARKWGGKSEAFIGNSLTELENGIREARFDMVVLLAPEYLILKQRVPLEPFLVSARGAEIHYHQVLVVRKDSGFRTVTDLRGKTVLQQKGAYDDGNDLWLDTLLMRKGIAAPKRYFASNRIVLNPTGAVMPVFFGKADACIMSKRSLKIMGELNPQLQRELMIIEESPPILNCIIAFREGISSSRKELFGKILGTLDQNTEGQQLLTLFKMTKLVPYQHLYLVPVEKLFRENHDLKRRAARRN